MKKIDKQLDIGMVRNIMDRDPITKIMILHFSQKERSRAETSVDSLIQLTTDGRRLTRGEVVNSLKSLAQAGAGMFLAGRRGFASRFRWGCDLVQMAKEALSGIPAAQKAPTGSIEVDSSLVHETLPAKSEDVALTLTEPPAGTKTYFFPLRPMKELHVELPNDITSVESTRLAQFIQSLGH